MKLAIRAFALSLIVAFAAAQIAWAGGGTVHVRGYVRKDGTYVAPYTRSAPGSKSYSARTSRITTPSISSGVTPYVPTTSSTTSIAPAVPTAAVAPQSTPDLRTNKQTVQDAIAAGRIVVKDAKPTVISTTTTVSASGVVVRDSHGRIKRSESAKHEFMRQSGYAHGRPGYVVDHIVPLKRGGCDCPSNMQWQTIQEAKAKDKVE
jgi:hypothetical protein